MSVAGEIYSVEEGRGTHALLGGVDFCSAGNGRRGDYLVLFFYCCIVLFFYL